MNYKVESLLKVEKAIEKLDGTAAKKIRDRIRSLTDNPRPDGCIKLSGFANAYRIRVGKYRIIYEVYDAKILVIVINVAHRKDVYR